MAIECQSGTVIFKGYGYDKDSDKDSGLPLRLIYYNNTLHRTEYGVIYAREFH